MSRALLKGGSDTHARSDRPTAEYGGQARIRLQSGAALGFIWFQVSPPIPRGATVTSAILRLRQIGDWSGSTTITVKRVDAKWKSSKLNWNNKPGTIGTAAPVTRTSGMTDGSVWEFDVTSQVQTVVNGAGNYGFQISTTDTNVRFLNAFNGKGRKPTLELVWSDAPSAPTTLVPSGAAVSGSHPVLSFDYHDVSGDSAMSALQVQISDSSDFAAPVFDSGEWATSVPELRLADTGYAGVSLGATVWWRVRAKGDSGKWSQWSDAESFSRQAKSTLVLSSPAPAPNNFVSEATPPIVWVSPGQVFRRVALANADDPGTFILDTGKVKSTANSYTLPKGLIDDDQRYIVTVWTWDGVARVHTDGDATYVKVSQEFFFDYDPTIDPAVNLDATQAGAAPWVQLHWTRATAPDAWSVVRSGKVIASDLTPAETTDGGTAYTWTDYTAAPNRTRTYRVAAQVNGKASKGGPTFEYAPAIGGIWLADPDDGTQVVVWGDDAGTFDHGEDSALYRPIGAKAVVKITTSLRGLEGSVSGFLVDTDAMTQAAARDALLTMKEQPAGIFRLALGDMNIPVVLGNVTVAPSPLTVKGTVVTPVKFNFWQQGELPFSARL